MSLSTQAGASHRDSLRDRAKDVIISGGENISTIEVEQAIVSTRRHPMTLIRREHGEQPRRENAIAYRTLLDALKAAITR